MGYAKYIIVWSCRKVEDGGFDSVIPLWHSFPRGVNISCGIYFTCLNSPKLYCNAYSFDPVVEV